MHELTVLRQNLPCNSKSDLPFDTRINLDRDQRRYYVNSPEGYLFFFHHPVRQVPWFIPFYKLEINWPTSHGTLVSQITYHPIQAAPTTIKLTIQPETHKGIIPSVQFLHELIYAPIPGQQVQLAVLVWQQMEITCKLFCQEFNAGIDFSYPVVEYTVKFAITEFISYYDCPTNPQLQLR